MARIVRLDERASVRADLITGMEVYESKLIGTEGWYVRVHMKPACNDCLFTEFKIKFKRAEDANLKYDELVRRWEEQILFR